MFYSLYRENDDYADYEGGAGHRYEGKAVVSFSLHSSCRQQKP